MLYRFIKRPKLAMFQLIAGDLSIEVFLEGLEQAALLFVRAMRFRLSLW